MWGARTAVAAATHRLRTADGSVRGTGGGGVVYRIHLRLRRTLWLRHRLGGTADLPAHTKKIDRGE